LRRRADLAFRIGSEVGRSGLAVRIVSEAGRSELAFRIGSVAGLDKLARKLAGAFQTRERQRRQESRRVDLERRTQGTVSDSSAAARSGSASASADGGAAVVDKADAASNADLGTRRRLLECISPASSAQRTIVKPQRPSRTLQRSRGAGKWRAKLATPRPSGRSNLFGPAFVGFNDRLGRDHQSFSIPG